MGPAESDNNFDLQPIEVKTFQNVSFPGEVKDKLFIQNFFTDVGAKGTIFQNCNFSHSVFTRAYFRNAKFIQCTFIGAHFYDCNFRHAELVRCDFKYATFQGTIIPPQEVIANLPEWPNVKCELLRSHRINAQSVGDTEAIKLYIREEMTALREHYRRAREKKEAYYSEKYKGFGRWIEVRWESFTLWLGWVTWGYGEYPTNLLKFAIFSLLVLTIAVMVQTGDLFSATTTVQKIGSTFWESLKSTISLFLGLPQANQIPVNWIIMSITIMLRYVLLGLFIAVIFRRFSRR